jgi:hypothetical protein
MADIDLSGSTGTEFNIIGTRYNPFTGVFDGNGHTISNFTYISMASDYVGLFGYVSDANAEIKSLILVDPNIAVGIGSYAGALVGFLGSGRVSNCYIEAGVVSGKSHIGGMVGHQWSGLLIGCGAEVGIQGDDYLGGLVGWNEVGEVIRCHGEARVTGTGRYVGGLVGYNYFDTITNCYSTGSVSGTEDVGGLVGYNYHGTITNCYSSCSITGDEHIGGLVGYNYYGIITDCYATGRIEGVEYVGCLLGVHHSGSYNKSFWDSDINPEVNGIGNTTDPNVIGESTTNMQTESTFTDAGWDFVGEIVNGPNDIWDICEGTNYPRFVLQIPPGDFLCPDGVNFFDYSFFASQWAEDNCAASNDCDGRDLDLLGSVDIKDLRIFADNWLAGL